MQEFWSEDRRQPRGRYVIPCALTDPDSGVRVKAVLLDISAEGCRVFTNDRRVMGMRDDALVGRSFELEFDFHELSCDGIVAKVANVHPGKDPQRERQLGLQFAKIGPVLKRDINRHVMSDAGA